MGHMALIICLLFACSPGFNGEKSGENEPLGTYVTLYLSYLRLGHTGERICNGGQTDKCADFGYPVTKFISSSRSVCGA